MSLKLGGTGAGSLSELTEALADDDRFLVLNVSDTATAPADPDGSDQWIDGITAARAFLRKGVMLVAPSADTSGATDTSAVNAVTQAGFLAMLVPGGLYYVTNLTADSYGGIDGRNATLAVPSGSTGYALAVKTPASSKQLLVADVTIQCDGNGGGGVLVDNTGFAPEAQWVPYDSMHQFRNVRVLGAAGDAWHLDNQVRSCRFTDCVQYNCSGYGLYLGAGAASDGVGVTDCHFTNFISGHSGNDGIYVAAASGNNLFSGCKGFYAGYTEASGAWTSTTAVGCYNAGNWNRFTGCSFQQNALHGMTLDGCTSVTVSGCEFDTNSAGDSVTTGCGLNLAGTVAYVTVTGCVGSNNSDDPPGAQAYGMQLDAAMTNCQVMANAITGVSDGINQAGSFADNGGNTIMDYTQAVIGSPLILKGQPAAYVAMQSTAPAGAQYLAQLLGYDPESSGYGLLGAVTGAGLFGVLQMGMPAATSAVTVASSTTITSLASKTIPAHDARAGAVYRFKLNGVLSVASAGTATTYVCDVRWGGTGGTLLMSLHSTSTANSPLFPNSTALSSVPVLVEGEIEFRSDTTVTGWMRMTWTNSATAATAPVSPVTTIASPATVTTSSDEALSVDWTWGTNSASNSITIESSVFERVA